MQGVQDCYLAERPVLACLRNKPASAPRQKRDKWREGSQDPTDDDRKALVDSLDLDTKAVIEHVAQAAAAAISGMWARGVLPHMWEPCRTIFVMGQKPTKRRLGGRGIQ